MPFLVWEPLDVPPGGGGGGSRAPTPRSVFPDTNQTQPRKHIQGQGACSVCVYTRERDSNQEADIYREKGGYRRGDEGKDETLTQKQTAPSFNSQLRAV